MNEFNDTNISLSFRHDLSSDWQLRADVVRSEQEEDHTYIWAVSTEQIVGDNGLLSREIGDWHVTLKDALGRLEVGGAVNSPYGSVFKSSGLYIQEVIEIGQQFVALAGLRYDRAWPMTT